MMITLGVVFLLLALLAAFLQSVLPMIGYYRDNRYLLAFARPSLIAQCLFVISAYVILTIAFVSNDFSIEYVAANSHPALPFMYRLTATWGGHEGSILLWIVLLSIWSTIFAYVNYPAKIKTLVISILGLVSFCFLAFLIFTSNPFVPTMGEVQPRDLNPLLQDPGFVIHPPILYVGYVGFAVPFALTMAGLLTNRLDPIWASFSRRFTLAAWAFLTFGITLGSWWAYHVLGWGGFWFWDPVENASLLPWLVGTALIHVFILVEKKDISHYWAALLAIVGFALSLLGTFLVRSGVLVSAHTFANDPARGVFLLLLFAIVMGGALLIYFLSFYSNKRTNNLKFALTREMALLLNSALFTLIMLTVLLGTLYPLIMDALQLGSISVGAPYFNLALTPLIIVVMLFMAVAPYYQWECPSLNIIFRTTYKNLLLSVLATILIAFFFGKLSILAAGLTCLCIWLILNMAKQLKLKPSMCLTHMGFAVLLLGILLSSGLSTERQLRMQPGQITTIGPYQFFFIGIKSVAGSNYRGIQASFEVSKGKRHIAYLFPEKRIYPVREMIMTKVAIHPTIIRDLYMALGEPLNEDDWSVRLYYKPFVRFIWLGGLIMMIGGLLSVLTRRSSKLLTR